MGCFDNQCYESDYSDRSGHCVADVVRKIVNAQREAVDDCVTSCQNSIEELLSRRPRSRRNATTIPFILICKENCKPFVGTGFIDKDRDRSGRRGGFECVESPILRVRDFVRGSNSCVNVEILVPVHDRRPSSPASADAEDLVEASSGWHSRRDCGSFCDQFGHRRIENFRETGVCITLDLNCFCGITCLDPITPEPL